jgi:hypothetical protein
MHIARINRTGTSIAPPSGLAGCEIRGPPAVSEAGLENFAADLQQPSQLSSAEHVRAIPDEEFIVVACTLAIQAARCGFGGDRSWLIIHDRDCSRRLMEPLIDSPLGQLKRYTIQP